MNKNSPDLAVANPEQIEIGNRGYVRGAKFYLGLTYKRIKGKLRVRGERKLSKPVVINQSVVAKQEPIYYSVKEWKQIKKEEKAK